MIKYINTFNISIQIESICQRERVLLCLINFVFCLVRHFALPFVVAHHFALPVFKKACFGVDNFFATGATNFYSFNTFWSLQSSEKIILFIVGS